MALAAAGRAAQARRHANGSFLEFDTGKAAREGAATFDAGVIACTLCSGLVEEHDFAAHRAKSEGRVDHGGTLPAEKSMKHSPAQGTDLLQLQPKFE